MNESDESTTEDSSDCGDETSTYAGRDQDTHVPEPPNSQDELDYLVCLVSSSEKEDKQEFSKLVNLAESSQKPSIKTPSSGMKKKLQTLMQLMLFLPKRMQLIIGAKKNK